MYIYIYIYIYGSALRILAVDTLRLTAEQHLSVALFASGALNGLWWDTIPCVSHLECAYRGTGHFSNVLTRLIRSQESTKKHEGTHTKLKCSG